MPDLYNLRNEYLKGTLSKNDLNPDPLKQFHDWFNEVLASKMPDPTVMVLSTSGTDNRPSSRMVLLKEYSEEGFTFFTHYQSKKGKQIEQNPYGALLFPWNVLERQVRIEGKIVKVSPEKSDEYFLSRPEGSRIGAWTSPQSEEISSRKMLEEMENKFRDEFKTSTVPRPPQWGGYLLIPDLFEFWQGRESRLHDRFEYYPDNGSWKIRRLAP